MKRQGNNKLGQRPCKIEKQMKKQQIRPGSVFHDTRRKIPHDSSLPGPGRASKAASNVINSNLRNDSMNKTHSLHETAAQNLKTPGIQSSSLHILTECKAADTMDPKGKQYNDRADKHAASSRTTTMAPDVYVTNTACFSSVNKETAVSNHQTHIVPRPGMAISGPFIPTKTYNAAHILQISTPADLFVPTTALSQKEPGGTATTPLITPVMPLGPVPSPVKSYASAHENTNQGPVNAHAVPSLNRSVNQNETPGNSKLTTETSTTNIQGAVLFDPSISSHLLQDLIQADSMTKGQPSAFQPDSDWEPLYEPTAATSSAPLGGFATHSPNTSTPAFLSSFPWSITNSSLPQTPAEWAITLAHQKLCMDNVIKLLTSSQIRNYSALQHSLKQIETLLDTAQGLSGAGFVLREQQLKQALGDTRAQLDAAMAFVESDVEMWKRAEGDNEASKGVEGLLEKFEGDERERILERIPEGIEGTEGGEIK
ncbi:MAG: hypothetical protein LQ340_002797 [Diploschistes diacapsis]|nr:MAG: hypothetical protein LQ340_002797 [Diploschistes diacapsis]